MGLYILCEPIVRVLYERGRFGPVETAGTAAAVAMYALGIVGLTATKVAVQAFFALGDTRTPVKVSIGAMAVNCAVAAALAGPLGHVGLALATSVSATANALVLTILLRRRLPGPPVPGARRAWLRTVLVSAGLALGLWTVVAALAAAAGPARRERRGSRRSSIGATARVRRLSRRARRGGGASRVGRAHAAVRGGVPCAAGRRVDILARDRTTCGPCCSA